VYLLVTAVVTVAVVARTALADWESRTLRRFESTDPLTGLLNRSAFSFRAGELMSESAALDAPLSLAVIDIDDFARFNVIEGRDAGDAALAAVARALDSLYERSYPVARLGGDEFAVMMPSTAKGVALRVAAELVTAASSAAGFEGRFTFSAGVATLPDDATDTAELVRCADAALYWAKYQGKNRIAPYDTAVTQALTVEARIRDLAEKSRLDIVRALAAATDTRDAATSYHSRQVAVLAAMLCESIGLDPEHAHNVELAALLHDVGKVGVPDSVLRKRAWLSSGERAVLNEHAELGARILEATELGRMAPWVRAHHERWDGTGFPDGLAGTQIPLEARIIGVCDAYDQMVSGGSDTGPLSRGAALQELDHGMGAAFDPDLAEALIDVVGRSRSMGPTEVWQR
jgi:diguanylate cyclase (GGDEF)-like protein/putative nucleotidyltransferase with HDIG domain